MEKGISRIIALLLTALLCASALPSTAADGSTEPEHYAFGMEYNYSNLNEDFEALSGLPLDDILMDIMESADDAGIDLQLIEETTGVSTMIVDQYADGTETLMIDGTATELERHVTELTLRHGGLMDFALISEWDDAWAGWDLTFTVDVEGVMSLDATYVEFRDATGAIYGYDTELTAELSQSFALGLYGSVNGEDASDVLPLHIEASVGVDFEIKSASSEIRLEEPSTLNNDLAGLEAGDWYEWGFEDYFYDDYDDDYVYWYGFNEVDTDCEWNDYDEYECHTIETIDPYWYELYDADECYWTGSEYECYGPGYSYWYGYCEYYNNSDGEMYACTDDFGWESDWEYHLYDTNYEDGTNPPGVGYEDWNYYPYCEYYGAVGEFYCTYDFNWDDDYQNSLSWTHYQDDTSPYDSDEDEGDVIDSMDGVFSTSSGFNFELTGLPADEFGFPEGDWDFSASDSATDSGTFNLYSDEVEISNCGMEMELMDGSQMITMDDGSQTEVLQAYMIPVPMPMVCQVGSLVANALVGSEDAATMFSEIEAIDMWANSLAGDNGDSEGDIWIEIEESSEDEVVFYLDHCCELDWEENYEVSVVLEADDGDTVDATSFVVMEDYGFWEEVAMGADGWGDYCVYVEVTEVGSDYVEVSGHNCFTIEQEPEPSQLLIDIVESFADSTLENSLEIFGENMEHRLGDYEADIAYDDGDAYVLWDPAANKVVGFQVLVSNDDTSNWWTLIGPESNTYGTAPTPVSATYFSGVQATDAEAAVEDSNTIEELVDLTMHDTTALEAAVEAGGDAPGTGDGDAADEEEGVTEETLDEGLLPFLSPAATIAIVALAGLVSTLRPRRD